MQVTYRTATEEDLDFIWEAQSAGLGEAVRREFGVSSAEHRIHFENNFTVEGLQIVLADGEAAGYLMWEERSDDFYIGNIVLTPDYQHRGIGTAIVTSITDRAEEVGRDVRLQVLKANPARAFYEKHGFVVHSETAPHYQMKRSPSLS